MRHDPVYQPITVAQFLGIEFGRDAKYELIAGTIRMMTGGSPAHSRVASNILVFLAQRLRGSGCRAYNSDAGVAIDENELRYPDVSVFCGNPASPDREKQRVLDNPRIVFEILSPSTSRSDQPDKLDAYRALPSIDTIIFVDPIGESAWVIQRLGPDSWRDDVLAQPHDIELPAIGVTIPHGEIFARD